MKKYLLSLVLFAAILFVGAFVFSSPQKDPISQNVEALSDGEGIWLRDCTMYMLWGGTYAIGPICQPGTMSNYVLPCSYEGTGGVTMGKCYVQ